MIMNVDINHANRAHAKLSASGSSRWLNCPGSVKAEEGYKSESSVFAEEGTLAHELADLCLQKKVDSDSFVGKEVTGKIIDSEMAKHVQEYLDYVRSYETAKSELYTEKRVDFSNSVPDGFGTMDSAVIDYDSGICHIFDLKYGRGVEVSAVENTQAQLYAIGLYNELGFLGEIKSFCIHIVQPRIRNYSNWEISVEDLNKFSKHVSARAKIALGDNAPRIPGDKQCQWCKAKGNCNALAKFTEQVISAEFDNLDEVKIESMSDDRKRLILDNRSLIESFMKAVESEVFGRLSCGEKFEGYKIVEGRSVRKWGDNAEEALVKELGDDAYEKKLIGITAAQKLIGKEGVDELAYKPPGKLTLAAESDKRKAVNITATEDQFEVVT